MKMKNFAVCYNQEISHSVEIKDKLVKILLAKGLSVDVLDIDGLKEGFDFVFVIGGDGTILKTARFYAKYQTPIFGINLGRLGFLSQSSKEDIEKSVDEILEGHFIIEDRIMLQSGDFSALNDFVIKGQDMGRTSRFSLKINDICPHTLNARPIVVPDCEKITVSTDLNSKYVLSTDGQELYEISSDIVIEKSLYTAKLALLKNSEFYSILRNKLHWAMPPAYEN